MVAPWGSGRCEDGRRTRVKTAYSRYEGSGVYMAHEYSGQALQAVYVMVLLAAVRPCNTICRVSSVTKWARGNISKIDSAF